MNYVEMHKRCIGNRIAVESSEMCVCFHCLAHFKPKTIVRWITSKAGETAICPQCKVDAVLPDDPVGSICDEYLKGMHDFWFSRTATLRELGVTFDT